MERKALLILGMHRAGTSALARVCSLRGARLPRNVLPPNAGNADGYWEPREVVELNDHILGAFDLAWDDPFVVTRLPAVDTLLARFGDQARELLAREYGDAPLLVLKDPRCTLLHGFWDHVLRAQGIAPCPVVMMRPWQAVVDSLMRRDGTSAAGAGLLYVAYGLAAADVLEAGASFVTYGQLLDDWRAATARIAAEQRFAWPEGADEAGIDAYLRASGGSPRVAVPGAVADWADAVWRWCAEAATGVVPATDRLRPAREGMAALAGQVAPLLRDRTRRQRSTEAERDEAIAERNASLEVYRETDLRLQATQADFRRRETEHEDELARERAAFASERQGLLDRWQAAEELRQQAEGERDRLLRLYQDTNAERDRLLQQYQDTDAERDRLLQLYRDTDAELRKTQADYVERDQECAGLRDALLRSERHADHLQGQLSTVLGSRSWKLTRPLRAGMRLLRGELAPAGAAPATEPATIAPRQEDGRRADIAAAAPDGAQPHPERRPHPELRRFLVEEFDGDVAAEVTARIDHYRLPIPTGALHGAARVSCSEEQAVAWARDIATRAAGDATAGVPDVSIVLPVYNQAPFTLACLDALLAHRSRYSFEVLVGDDGSTDATAAALAVPLPRVRHVRHDDNLGFVRNCNATAAQAAGRYVLFLNNDTQVLPGWLDELVGLLEADPRIGLAGSKLVYPDGRLQECGAIVWRDGSAWNYGRLSDPRRPEFCYVRDVDYVSGASIALPRALWEELGGFDELFVPAYAEDADLAFRIRDRGLRTVVQPLSQVLHFEGISSGTDLGSGTKAYQVENLRKLRARWAHVLARHRENADRPELEKERGVERRVLFVDHCTPTPNEDAGSVVASEIMDLFAGSGYKVTFVPEDNFAHVGEPTRCLQRRGIEAIYHPAYSRMAAFLAGRDDAFDVIFLHRFAVGEAHMAVLRRKYPRARILFLNADMHHVRELREAELSGDADALARARLTRERELRVIADADATLVHSAYEQALVREALPSARVVLFPLIHEPATEVPPLADRDGVCFVGGFRHPPNGDGIRWFVETAWPLVRERVPGARLDIVGSHMPADIRALGDVPGVRAVGFVEHLDAYLARRRLTIAPLRYGAGAKGKVAGSLARGVPVVCTPVAAEGMSLSPGQDVLVADTPEALAAEVARLLVDDAAWQRLSAAGLDYARRVTSRQRARERLLDLLASL